MTETGSVSHAIWSTAVNCRNIRHPYNPHPTGPLVASVRQLSVLSLEQVNASHATGSLNVARMYWPVELVTWTRRESGDETLTGDQ